MRFIKRLSAVALAIVITVSSIQIPGGTSYAAEPADGIANGQDVTILTAEEKEGTEAAKPDEGALTDDDSRTDSDSQPGDDNAAGDDDRPDHESVSEEETDAGQVSGNDAGEPDQSVDTEEIEAEEIEIVEAEIEGAYQFGDMPSVGGGISVFSVSTYDDSVEEYLYQQMLKRTDWIDLSGYNVSASNFVSLVSGVLNEHPDLYFVNRTYSVSNGYLHMTYSTDYDDDAFQRKTEAALACVTDDMSDDMKAIALHDYLVINVEYDYENYLSDNIPADSYNAYGALVNGTAVCNGYALAYKYLLYRAGIKSYMVTSMSMNHAWNLMELDGEYYHVDTTWDDPVWDMVGRVCHDNLLRSDENLEAHYGWTVTSGTSAVDYKATETKYENAFWVDCTSPLVFDGTDCYYISEKGMSLNKASFSNINATGTEVISVGRWMSASGGYYIGAYSGLYRINDRLFYNDGSSIYSINPDGTDRKTVFTPENTGGDQIFYSAYRNGKVVYGLQSDPYLPGKQTVLTAEIEGISKPVETYNITYVLDGGTNHKDNPASYTSETKIIILKDASKAGYIFEGWYQDAAYQQRVTKIPSGSTGDITLYAKWSQAKLEAENPNYTFTTLDDETVSSRADGKPKVLFFFRESSAMCQKMSQDLSQHMEEFNGVDIYAIEAAKATKEAVAQFKNDYGCDEITFCYDTGGTNMQCFYDYVDIARISNVGIPFAVYIDSQNRVQYAELGQRSWAQVLANLCDYCDYRDDDPEGTYKITYELNGGTNDSANPNTYTSETETITLKDAVRDGYTFEGWYKDAGFKEKVTEIVKGSAGDITLYAKWVKIRENGLNADNLNYTFTTLDDETVSSRADGKPKVLFFFKPDCYYCQKTSQDLSKNIKNFSGVDIYVIESFNSCTKDEVANFKKTYGCDEITYCYDKDGMSRYRVWNYVDMTNISSGNSVTTPVIIFIDAQNRVQYGTAGARSWTQILSDLQEYCGYGDEDTEETYKITYELNGGTNDSANPDTYTSETETITLKDAVKDGYTFEGWYKDAGFKEKVTEIVKGSAGDITLYAKWKEIPVEPGTYRIIYELNGGTNDGENPDTYTSDMETITLKDPSKEGFIFKGWYADARFNRKVTEIVKGSTGDITLYAKWKAAQIVIDPDQPENIRAGVYVRFTDYYRLGENSRPCYKYTGAAVKPAVEVYNNGTLLTSGTDYTIAYKNNTRLGVASLTVKGKGSFSGASNAVSFEIINADIRLDTDHPTKMTVTAGTKVTPVIMNGDKKLTAKDYKLEGDNLVNGKYAQATVGTPNTLTVTGIGSYAGSSFTIAVTVIDKKDAKKFAVTVDKNFKPVYDGNAIDLASLFSSPIGKGSITVTDSKEKNMVLENGKDFSVLCTSSLRDVGTVKFTVTGMGEYTGSVSKSFKISPFKVTDNIKFEVTFDNREYGYKASGATVDNLKVTYLGATTSADDDVVLTQGEDYKVSYVNNKKVSSETKKAQVRITFLGNYKGSKPVSKDFTITAARLSMQTVNNQAANTKVIVPDKVYDKAGKAYKSTPIVTVDGVRIKASNYTVSYTWVAEMGEGVAAAYVKDNNVKITLGELDDYAKVKVTITPKGVNYALADGVTAIEGEYYVRKKAEGVVDLSGAKVTFRDKVGNQLKALEYNGRAYYTPEGNNPGTSAQADPNAVYVDVALNGKPVDPSLYDVAWTNATAKGKATVVVTGKGTGAVGSRSQTISIKAMALKGRDIAYFMVNMANSLKNIL